MPPKHLYIVNEINLKPDFQPPFGPLYGLSQIELKAQKEWLNNNLKTGFRQPSSSPAPSLMLFVKK
jgi:hypothetical protein